VLVYDYLNQIQFREYFHKDCVWGFPTRCSATILRTNRLAKTRGLLSIIALFFVICLSFSDSVECHSNNNSHWVRVGVVWGRASNQIAGRFFQPGQRELRSTRLFVQYVNPFCLLVIIALLLIIRLSNLFIRTYIMNIKLPSNKADLVFVLFTGISLSLWWM